MDMDMMTVGETARAVGVSTKAIRVWESRGLIPAAERTATGYRSFTATDLDRLRFIRQAKTLGLTLSEIGRIIATQYAGASRSTATSPRSTVKWPILGSFTMSSPQREAPLRPLVLMTVTEPCVISLSESFRWRETVALPRRRSDATARNERSAEARHSPFIIPEQDEADMKSSVPIRHQA